MVILSSAHIFHLFFFLFFYLTVFSHSIKGSIKSKQKQQRKKIERETESYRERSNKHGVREKQKQLKLFSDICIPTPSTSGFDFFMVSFLILNVHTVLFFLVKIHGHVKQLHVAVVFRSFID